MRRFKIQLAALALGASLALVANASPEWHDRDYPGLRGLIDRTQNDLRMASGLEHGEHQRERYQHAQDELSSFDRGLSKGHFDRGRLDRSIDDLKSVLDHNTLDPGSRDALRHDVEDLRIARERHEH